MNDLKQQYREGIDKLWQALGLTDAQDEDVFTLASHASDYSKHLERVIRMQTMQGPLSEVLLNPCPKCHRYSVDEWYEGDHTNESAVEVASIQEARDLYRVFFCELRESHYLSREDSYTSFDDADNFIVNGSSDGCKECQA